MSTIDIPKLIARLEVVGSHWHDAASIDLVQGLCRHAATALRQQQDTNYREITHRLGLLLIELGKKLTGGA